MNIGTMTGAAPSESIRVSGVTKRFAGVPVLRDVALDVPAGSVVALLGPSGCGKTTLLRTIAGLETPERGQVSVGDRVLTTGSTVVAPERRRIGMVFQDWALFPHLTVGRNVAYGLDREQRRAGRVEETLALVGLAGMADRLPGTLSGGQQQRVALARALAPRPSVLLLDEPFSNLDTALRVDIRTEVHRLLTGLGVTTVFVTHDQEEAFVLGDEVAVMRDGVIEQQATPAQLYARPATPWVADFVGDANFVTGAPVGGGVSTPFGWVPLAADVDLDHADRAQVLVRPEHLRIAAGDAAEVELVEFYGHDTVYELRLSCGDRLRARVGAAPTFGRGDSVSIAYDGPAASAWPAAGAEISSRVPVPQG